MTMLCPGKQDQRIKPEYCTCRDTVETERQPIYELSWRLRVHRCVLIVETVWPGKWNVVGNCWL